MADQKKCYHCGVAGGATAAARLRRLEKCPNYFERNEGADISFANCGLPYYIGEKYRKRETYSRLPAAFNKRTTCLHTKTEARRIDL